MNKEEQKLKNPTPMVPTVEALFNLIEELETLKTVDDPAYSMLDDLLRRTENEEVLNYIKWFLQSELYKKIQEDKNREKVLKTILDKLTQEEKNVLSKYTGISM